jgi:anthranilate phosphoribosyltransferase
MSFKDILARAVSGAELEPAQMEQAIDTILRGEATPAQIGGLLVALRMKGETIAEVAAAARVFRRHAVPVKLTRPAPILDTCGTGGDGSDSFNISTVSAIVVAAAGVTVAKHGNRAASSKSGSADVLEALGIDLGLGPEHIARCIDEVGIGFLFARAHHPAMKHAGPVRAELGVRTLFNWLGPLTNPAGATHQLLGVGDASRLEMMAQVLGLLGVQAAWVVHGHGGLDEVSLSGPTRVAALANGTVRCFEITPADFGVQAAEPSALRGGDAEENAAIARAILSGEGGARRDAVLVNAGAALCVAGTAGSPREGAERARHSIDSGAARAKLEAWAAFKSTGPALRGGA